jgi:hypothetical protein
MFFFNREETHWLAVDWIERNSVGEIHIAVFLVDTHSEETAFNVKGRKFYSNTSPVAIQPFYYPELIFSAVCYGVGRLFQ